MSTRFSDGCGNEDKNSKSDGDRDGDEIKIINEDGESKILPKSDRLPSLAGWIGHGRVDFCTTGLFLIFDL